MQKGVRTASVPRDGSAHPCLPLFSSPERLEKFLIQQKIDYVLTDLLNRARLLWHPLVPALEAIATRRP